MEWYEAEVQDLEKSLQQRKLPANPVVFYGSSTIRLWGHLADDLAEQRAVNVGFGGSTLEACVYFFERLVVPVRPASLVVYAGDNDLGDGRMPAEVLAFFQALAEKADRYLGQVPFFFISVKPSPARINLLSRIRKTNWLVRDEIQSRPRYSYINVFDAMLGPTGKPEVKLFTEDGLHMGPAGYQLWVKLLAPYRDRIFTTTSS